LEKLRQTLWKDHHDSLDARISRHAAVLEGICQNSDRSKAERLEEITQILPTQIADLKSRLLALWRQTYLTP
jgi:hypothetical protein